MCVPFSAVPEIEKLFELPYFQNVGKRDEYANGIIASWDAAVASRQSDEWEYVSEAIHSSLMYGDLNVQRIQSLWIPAVREIKAGLKPLYDVVLARSGRVNAPAIAPQYVVNGHLLMICMEARFSEELDWMPYTDLFLPIYKAGHFPCGWSGDANVFKFLDDVDLSSVRAIVEASPFIAF